jgi:hypothetical protein
MYGTRMKKEDPAFLLPFAVLWFLIRIQLFISMPIQIQGAKPMRIYPDPDPGQTLMSLKSQKVQFYMKNYLLGKHIL